ncbi:MAG: hypothetical protein KF767_00155 [Bdellovibrionaceae bacterium]|nr:hypothetical protein [Pseudobdellovibrionaceae bacterium]
MLIAAGLAARLTELRDVPYGIDSDQTRVLLVGRQALATGQFRVYADESTRFEAMSSYLFALSEKFFGDARVLSFIFSFADLVLLGWLLRRRGTSWEFTLGGVALLAASPFAIYYGRISGPCVGASTILLAFFLARARWSRTLWLTLGLFYYSILRLLWIYELAAGVYRRDWKRAGAGVAALVILLSVSALVSDLGTDTQLRGGYNFHLSPEELGARVVDGIRIWMGPPSARMWESNDSLVTDPVSSGFAWVLGSAPAMGVGFALLFLLAWIQFGQDLFTRTRAIGLREAVTELPSETKFFLISFFALMLSPTYSHALFLAPLAVYFVILAFVRVADSHFGVRVVVMIALVISSWSGLVQSGRMWDHLRQPGQFDETFADRVRGIFEEHILKEELRVTYYTPQHYDVARFWAAKSDGRVTALPPFDPAVAVRSLELTAAGNSQVVYFDVQKLNTPWLDHPEAQAAFTMQDEIEQRMKRAAEVVDRSEIKVFGQVVARRYVIRFR